MIRRIRNRIGAWLAGFYDQAAESRELDRLLPHDAEAERYRQILSSEKHDPRAGAKHLAGATAAMPVDSTTDGRLTADVFGDPMAGYEDK